MWGKKHKLIYFLIALAFGQEISAQNITRSPYSVIGLGESVSTGNAAQFSMGGVNQGIRRYTLINWQNPASYSAIRTTVIEAGGALSLGTFTTNTASSQVNNAWLSYLNFAVPLANKGGAGLSFGLSPFTSIGYDITSSITIPNDTFSIPASYIFSGRGGLSKVHIGYGMDLYKGLSAGANLGYVFGRGTRTTQLFIPSQYNMFNLNEDRGSYTSGLISEIGTQYQGKLRFKVSSKQFEMVENPKDPNGQKIQKKVLHSDSLNFTFGATYQLESNLTGDEEYLLRTLPNGALSGSKDTIENKTLKTGTIHYPASLKLGFSIGKPDYWMLAGDYHQTAWSGFTAFGQNDSLRDAYGFRVGGYFCPDPLDNKNFLKRMEYRAGFRFDQTNVYVNGHGMNEWGVSAGIGAPLSRLGSKLNIGMEYVQRGTKANNPIQENYFRIILGITFSDRWFLRYRYD